MDEREKNPLFDEIAEFLREQRQLPKNTEAMQLVDLDPPGKLVGLTRRWKELIAGGVVIGSVASLGLMMASHAAGNTELLQTSIEFFITTPPMGVAVLLIGSLIQRFSNQGRHYKFS